MERSFVAIKPDGVQRGLIGAIISRYEKKGFKIVGMKYMIPKKETVEEHYKEHKGKKFYPPLVKYFTSGPVVAMVLEGKNVISEVRKMNGATKPTEAAPGTIRGDFALEVGRNIVHASDSKESAKREIGVWFTEKEQIKWDKTIDKLWIYED